MKKILLLCLSLILVVFMVGCSNSSTTSSKISATVTTEKQEYQKNSETINLTVKNNSNAKLYFGEDFALEKQSGNSWTEVHKDHEISNDVIKTVDKNSSSKVTMDIVNQYNSLEVGNYRVVVVLSDNENKLENGTKVYGEFSVK